MYGFAAASAWCGRAQLNISHQLLSDLLRRDQRVKLISQRRARRRTQPHPLASTAADRPRQVDASNAGSAGRKTSNESVDDESLARALRSPSLEEYAEQRKEGTVPLKHKKVDSVYNDVWVLSVEPAKAFELRNQYIGVGVLLDRNFADFEPVPGYEQIVDDATLEQLSVAKAKMIFHLSGRPAIVETNELLIDPPEPGNSINKTLQQGYKTRKVRQEADAILDRIRPISDENRVTRFRSVVAYYDGEIQLVCPGAADVAIVFSAARRVTIAIAVALNSLYVQLAKHFQLQLTNGNPPSADDDDSEENTRLYGATLLRERIRREGVMLDGSIVKVSSFVNHKVDPELMEACGIELAERLRRTSPTKVLTVESTGLIIGLPTARRLGVSLVFARKSRPITISDSYQTSYRSTTKGTNNELIVSCEYLNAGDRVVIVDDFLAGGSTAEALFKLASMAHAKVVGVGVLIEKMSDAGRAFLSGYNVPVESLAKVVPGATRGRINVLDEDPWKPPRDVEDDDEEDIAGEDSSEEHDSARDQDLAPIQSNSHGSEDAIRSEHNDDSEYDEAQQQEEEEEEEYDEEDESFENFDSLDISEELLEEGISEDDIEMSSDDDLNIIDCGDDDDDDDEGVSLTDQNEDLENRSRRKDRHIADKEQPE